MNGLDSLIACAGEWRGTNTLHDPHAGRPQESPSRLMVTPVLRGTFVRLDYTWSYQGAPQEGSLLMGFDPKDGEVTAHWIDTWHMSRKVLACLGPPPSGPTLSVRGSYPAPPDPDWGWRTEITPGGDQLRLVMVNISPDGQEDPAVEASYRRA